MVYRRYEPGKDEKSVSRLMRECGWPDPEKNKTTLEAFRGFVFVGIAHVAEYNGEAESLVTTHRGTMRMLDKTLSLCAVTGVCVSHILRQTKAAKELTAQAIMERAEECSMSALGIFDQGFYDKLGFGCFPYMHYVSVDPMTLNVPRLQRRPVRLELENLQSILRNFKRRRPNHGQVHLPLPGQLHAEMIFCENGFGVGFQDEAGEISHHMWIKPKGESGPYVVHWMVFEDLEGFVELLSFMRSMADQVNTFVFQEPWGVQVQDFLLRPFRTREMAAKGKHKNHMLAESWQQARILNMENVVSALRVSGGELLFRARISDPIEACLPEDATWRGVGGDWIMRLSEKGCSARRCSSETEGDSSLQVLEASVNAFTRLIFGVKPASGLAISDNLAGERELIDRLDELLRLPDPMMDMDF